jgi:hypothetical protein
MIAFGDKGLSKDFKTLKETVVRRFQNDLNVGQLSIPPIWPFPGSIIVMRIVILFTAHLTFKIIISGHEFFYIFPGFPWKVVL